MNEHMKWRVELVIGLLQNEINVINILAISSGNVDINYGISIAKIDSKVGVVLGISQPNIITNVGNLNVTALNYGTSTNTIIGTTLPNTITSINTLVVLVITTWNII